MSEEPKVLSDPRFRAGRTLVRAGRDGAIGMFATLVEESISEYGETSVETAACYYEYGNALFREADRNKRKSEEEEIKKDMSSNQIQNVNNNSTASTASEKRAMAAEAALKRLGDLSSSTTHSTSEKSDEKAKGANDVNNKLQQKSTTKEGKSDDDDFQLSLELMENSWSILDQYAQSPSIDKKYEKWCRDQLPRILIGIGEVLSSLGRHGDAADAYTRAIALREASAEICKQTSPLSVEYLKKRRLVVEANILVAEELLSCTSGEDVMTTETKAVLVKAGERVEFARGYYDKARDELQETVYLMAKVKSSGQDLGSEKEDICFLATMLMGIGNTLADLDEAVESNESRENAFKKQKR